MSECLKNCKTCGNRFGMPVNYYQCLLTGTYVSIKTCASDGVFKHWVPKKRMFGSLFKRNDTETVFNQFKWANSRHQNH